MQIIIMSHCEIGLADLDFRKRQQRPYTPLMISGTPVERVSSFMYLGVNISEDLTWTAHIQTQLKKARQRLYHLRQLSKFRVSPAILKTFYSGAIESVLTQCISVWYGNFSNQDCKALQRAERISGSALPSLQDIYLKRYKSRAAKIIKNTNHPGNRLFFLLPSGKRFFLLLFFSYLYLCIFSCVCVSYNCTVHGANLNYISLMVILSIIVYETNKKQKSWNISHC